MASITKISPLMATRGASGTLITITGTGFGASQGYGSVAIGAVDAIVASWGDTQITCRADDSPDAVRKRLAVYESQTAPVVDFYRNLGKLAHLDGVGSLDEVFTRITEALAGTPDVG